MQGTKLEFRLRVLILFVLLFLGFWAPWEHSWRGAGQVPTTWSMLARQALRTGYFSFQSAAIAVVVFAIVCALIGALMRTWGTAYLGADVMQAKQMQSRAVVADGPYRYVRNPLYLGTMLNFLALAILMPVSGAIFAVLTTFLFQLRLIAGEEAHLRQQLGEAYAAYTARVPRLLPSLGARVPATGAAQPRWSQAFVAEIYMWGTVISFAALAWHYNAHLITRGILISFGASLIAKAVMPVKVEAI